MPGRRWRRLTRPIRTSGSAPRSKPTTERFTAGCNVENVSYPCGTCAEAGAVAAMVCGGSAKIRRILVTSDGAALVAPCGACLQRILEFSLPETEILLADREGVKKTMTINELLPNAFKEF